MSVKDMTNYETEHLRVVRRVENGKYGDARWECICKNCGNLFVTSGHAIRTGHARSCRCLQREAASKLAKTHGKSKTRLYKTWAAMRQRCNNPNGDEYQFYGGKGITICSEWNDFETFEQWAKQTGYEPGLTIDRINNDKGYSPENCRWATRTEQNRNTSRTHRILDGEKALTAAEVGRIIGVSRSSVAKWCRNGEVHTLAQAYARRDAIDNGMYKHPEL